MNTRDRKAEVHAGSPAGASAWFRRVGTSAEGIYGLIIVAGMIVVSRNLTADSGGALLSIVATLIVFFVAHAYASAVSELVRSNARASTLSTAIRHGLRESSAMVLVGVIPIALLGLGVIGVVPEENAVWLALGADVALLSALGWLIAASRVQSIWARALSALLTASFGGVLIALKAFVHH